MAPLPSSSPPGRLDAALRHLWLHLAVGTALGAGLLVGWVVAPRPGQASLNWPALGEHSGELALVLLGCFVGALLAGVLRLPALGWLGRQAGRRQWPTALLLLASAGLFLAPILLVFLFGEGGQYIGRVSLAVSLPYLVGYVAATYWLRRQLSQPPQPGA